jgi:hypothetical protein
MSRNKQDVWDDINQCEAKLHEASRYKALLLEELEGYDGRDPIKLCNIWAGTYVSLASNPSVDELYRFDHIDGMIGICYNIQGDRINLRPLEEVYTWGFGKEVEVRD